MKPFSHRKRLALELLEDRVQPSAGVRSIDGTGNNLANPAWGSDGVDLLRTAPAAYGDGVSTPGGTNRPSARVISNAVSDQGDQSIINDRSMSAMVYAWGQFIDHDLDLTPDASPAQPFNIAVPKGDPSFDPAGTGTQVIPLDRSQSDPATGTSRSNPLQQVNAITAWLDGSQIYGSDAATADKLRTHSGGRLKTSAGNLLPYNNSATFPTGTLPMANAAGIVPDSQLFAAGDVRANENTELLSLQTLFVREHNRIADAVSKANPGLGDEAVYQTARAVVIGELQSITYNEWLPSLLGPNALAAYRGYNPSVNPGIANEFSTAIFRLGHSLLGDDVGFLDNNGNPITPEVPLSQTFFYPPLLAANGIDPLLKYLSSDPSSELDTKVVSSLRNELFGPPGAGGLDLASLNIQRGRDHGLADYNTMRAAYGLPRVTDFSQITSDPALQAKLRALYGSVNNIDAWVGALAENHVAGGSTGPLIRRVLADQFARLRDGDRFWFERTFSGPMLSALEHTTLADVIRRNTGLTNLQPDLFYFRAQVSGTVFLDPNRDGRREQAEPGLAGWVVQLLDATDGSVVATTTTDAHGQYRFTVQDGLATGKYLVREVLPAGWTQTSTNPPVLAITRGDTSVCNVDFGNFKPGTMPPLQVLPGPGQPPPPPPASQQPAQGTPAVQGNRDAIPPLPPAPKPTGPTTGSLVLVLHGVDVGDGPVDVG